MILPQLYFYPRSPCGERLKVAFERAGNGAISIHALLAESDVALYTLIIMSGVFLSTLSLRRATNVVIRESTYKLDFYPRSPCGERHGIQSGAQQATAISIHALLAESDEYTPYYLNKHTISIHALLAESDAAIAANVNRCINFYPRSPCGERLCWMKNTIK